MGAFTCYDLVTGSAVVSAAEQAGAPVVLLVSARSLERPDGEALVAGLGALAAHATAACCVQLDHVADVQSVSPRALDGAGAVMFDASSRSFAENLAATVAAVDVWRGVDVEGELGRLRGDEDVAGEQGASAFTDPGEAAEFAARSNVACLAVAVGNAHGPYREAPRLDLALIERLAAVVEVPLSLHGGSGIPAEQVRAGVAAGVRKVNFNADLRAVWFSELAARLVEHEASLDVLGALEGLAAALRAVVLDKLALLGWSERLVAQEVTACVLR